MIRGSVKHLPRSLHAKELAGDEDEILLGAERRIRAKECRVRSGKVDVGRGFLLDRSDDRSLSTCNEIVQLVVDLDDLGMQSTLLDTSEITHSR